MMPEHFDGNPWRAMRRPDSFETAAEELDWISTPVSLDRGTLSAILEERRRLAASLLAAQAWAERCGAVGIYEPDVIALAERVKAEG